ncbi:MULTISPECIES: DUF1292 domain-containing protein [Paenibacillus]|jgi:uncharacterized protein YrzB (UPF0473 family)|uniref:Uncharacterized protein n=2 Tax=Paenibacillus lactis TaxID=228574 RepID=G4HDM6_9BACL|nr:MULTISPECIES: DUF1292 domain-containing protein [Paenibacillus]EHB64945.1 protein of unknown function DUF1292 [Paenibacillus lactis 154]MBP1896406.1 uncharacterized protein YrzB (UPF0473 family) [Paenibacillus lactis]MCM3497485.1 DUF1292 domain-containing protein [Paenibacillus lactis]GIO90708.1 hypothetical protein J31TS3_19350 [Paenibacillus lactis]HAF99695.1 DUF1292 domain-containing protein [Paenibacillus lactis]
MADFSVENIVWTQVLKEAFGESIELEDEKGQVEVYDIAAEFEVDGQGYAILVQPDRMDEEYEVLRIVTDADGSLQLATIDDDEEWENVSELYDELTFPEEDED